MTGAAESKAEKAARLTALGYFPARGPGRCCLCRKPIADGQFIGKMPSSWKPETKRRHAHDRCVDRLREQIRTKTAALGKVAGPTA